MVTRNDVDQVFRSDGTQISATPVVRDVTAEVNVPQLLANLAADIVALQAIIDDTNANINTNPATRIKTMARAVRRLAKLQLADYSTPD